VCCPCGAELEAPHSGQLLCSEHQQQIARYVRRRFGPHRYGGRYAGSVEDFVQDCLERLVAPGGLDTFRPHAGRERADAFGAWLGVVLRYYCNNKLKYLGIRPDFAGELRDPIPEAAHAMTPAQAFTRQCILELVNAAVARVGVEWKSKGSKAAQRFDVFLPFVLGGDARYEQAQEVLGVSEGNAKRIKCNLAQDIQFALRCLVRDTLHLEPGLDHKSIERRIDEEIDALFEAAYPPEAEPCDQKSEDERPEPRP
jgi:DNA-directed RNA polymerase specialized sigma24 family protein